MNKRAYFQVFFPAASWALRLPTCFQFTKGLSRPRGLGLPFWTQHRDICSTRSQPCGMDTGGAFPCLCALTPPPPPRPRKRNSYSTYLSSHGGSSNAYTDTEDTVYFFDVGSDYLKGALDRFAQFFIAPQVCPSFSQPVYCLFP